MKLLIRFSMVVVVVVAIVLAGCQIPQSGEAAGRTATSSVRICTSADINDPCAKSVVSQLERKVNTLETTLNQVSGLKQSLHDGKMSITTIQTTTSCDDVCNSKGKTCIFGFGQGSQKQTLDYMSTDIPPKPKRKVWSSSYDHYLNCDTPVQQSDSEDNKYHIYCKCI